MFTLLFLAYSRFWLTRAWSTQSSTIFMWVAGITQGLMWRSYDQMGFLQYSFSETVQAMHPFYIIRVIGGLLYLTGALIMVYNVRKTIVSGNERNAVAAQTYAGG